MALVVKNPPANAGVVREIGSIPGSEDPLEECTATYSSILAWRIPWTGETDGLWLVGSKKVGHNRSNLTHEHKQLKHLSTDEQIKKILYTYNGILFCVKLENSAIFNNMDEH